MNKMQSNKYNMFVGVSGFLKKNRKAFKGVAAFEDTNAKYFELLGELMEVEARIEKGSKPTTLSKNKARIALAKKAGLISSSVSFYAYDTGNIELKNDVSYSYRRLIKAREIDFIAIMGVIYSACEKYQAQLEKYRLSEEMITEFKNEILAFNKLDEHAGALRAGLFADYQRSRDLFEEIDDLLDGKVDKMLIAMQSDHPKLFISYRAARTIIDHK